MGKILHPSEDDLRVIAMHPRLTVGMVQVWRGVTSGGTNEQISNRMGVTVPSVKRYLASLMARTGCKTRAQLAVRALRTRTFIMKPLDPKEFERTLRPRELQVFGLIAEGMETNEVAAELGISPITVKAHVQRYGGTLGSYTRTRILTRLYRAGLIK